MPTAPERPADEALARKKGEPGIGRHRGVHGWLLAASIPWLVRWSLLQDDHDVYSLPGLGQKKWFHVVCPENGCETNDWVTRYTKRSHKICKNNHPVQYLIACPECDSQYGYHRQPGGGR